MLGEVQTCEFESKSLVKCNLNRDHPFVGKRRAPADVLQLKLSDNIAILPLFSPTQIPNNKTMQINLENKLAIVTGSTAASASLSPKGWRRSWASAYLPRWFITKSAL